MSNLSIQTSAPACLRSVTRRRTNSRFVAAVADEGIRRINGQRRSPGGVLSQRVLSQVLLSQARLVLRVGDAPNIQGGPVVLILGRFTNERKPVLEALRSELSQRD